MSVCVCVCVCLDSCVSTAVLCKWIAGSRLGGLVWWGREIEGGKKTVCEYPFVHASVCMCVCIIR